MNFRRVTSSYNDETLEDIYFPSSGTYPLFINSKINSLPIVCLEAFSGITSSGMLKTENFEAILELNKAN